MSAIPVLGVGVGYRPALHNHILSNVGEIDFLEVLSDAFAKNGRLLHVLSTLFPCIPHSLNLSVGSNLDEEYMRQVERVLELAKPPWHSDHLAFTRVGDMQIGHLSPVPYTWESLDVVVANVRRVQERMRVPLAVENITAPFYWPNNEMEEHDFLCELVRRTGCLILLDLENVRVNAANHGRGGRDFLDRLPLEHVVQLHIAGGTHALGLEQDTHSAPVSEATWDLLAYFCELATPRGILLERDANFEPFKEIMGEIRRARGILESSTT